MTWWVFARGFLRDYARNSTNLVVLVLVPVVFVLVAADSLADAARLLGGDGTALEQATAGWAAGFLAAVAMYFQVSAARDADRRLLLCGARPRTLVVARLLTGAILAVVASAVSLAVLALRQPLDHPGRLIIGTTMFALVYLGIGAAVGAIARDPVNGTVVVLFVWILDVFFGPTLSSSDSAVTRLLPTHFISLWVADTPSGHAAWLGDVGISVAWVAVSLGGSALLIARTSAVGRGNRRRRHGAGARSDQYGRSLGMGMRELIRNPAMWALLALVPAVFIVLSDVITPHGHTGIAVRENGRLVVRMFDPAEIHAGTMAPISVASLAMLVGLFTILATGETDRRLCLAGLRPGVLLAVRLTTIGAAVLVAAAVSLAVVAAVFSPADWPVYALGNVLVAGTYALVGVLVGPIFGRVSGVFIAFLLPFLDVGISQSPMLSAQPDPWARWLPAYGGTRLVLDGALTSSFDELAPLLYAVIWLLALSVLTSLLWWRTNAGRTSSAAPTFSGRARP
ncbi:ABC transporter permease [Nocardioides sp. NPDC057767]|uniref:ABC transporter permease n=1 Tax=unclassified Nocardioides TaxID=2615069 RepID=UPI0036723DEF